MKDIIIKKCMECGSLIKNKTDKYGVFVIKRICDKCKQDTDKYDW